MDHFFLIWRTHFGARVLVGCYADRKADGTHLSTPGYHGEQYNSAQNIDSFVRVVRRGRDTRVDMNLLPALKKYWFQTAIWV